MTSDSGTIDLLVRRQIRASVERIFAAWTEPAQLVAWFGPAGVKCVEAEVDLRVGGRYRLANRFPDGNVVWISGEFERIAPPNELIYSWRVEPGGETTERVTVNFSPRGDVTDITIVHERIPDAVTRDRHEVGWSGCLDGLVSYLAAG